MNRIMIIGNLAQDPAMYTTQSGINYCRFNVAVRKRTHAEGQPDAEFMRVTAWRALGETCKKYLAKGRKVGVIGTAGVSCWQGNDGNPRATLEITADEVEFLSSAPRDPEEPPEMTPIEDEDCPFNE